MIAQWHDPFAFVTCVVMYICIHMAWYHYQQYKQIKRKRYYNEIRNDNNVRNTR